MRDFQPEKETRMAHQMRQIHDTCTVHFTRYDLRNAEERITQVRRFIERERSKLRKLHTVPAEGADGRQIMSALERMLQYFQDHRSRIEDQLRVTELA